MCVFIVFGHVFFFIILISRIYALAVRRRMIKQINKNSLWMFVTDDDNNNDEDDDDDDDIIIIHNK